MIKLFLTNDVGPKDFRHLAIENNVLPHVNGSSRLRVADSIDVLCSVKVSEDFLNMLLRSISAPRI